MVISPRTFRHLVGAVYAWSAAVFFGAVLFDVVYSSLLRDVDRVLTGSIFGEVSDLLLLLGAPMFLAGLAAIALSWNAPSARNLLALSLLALSLESLGPIVLFPVLRNSPDAPILGMTPYVHLVPLALASLLAFGAFGAMFRDALPMNS
jgi:hypothetical protein